MGMQPVHTDAPRTIVRIHADLRSRREGGLSTQWLPVLVDTNSLVIRDKVESRIFDVSLDVTLAQETRC